MHKNKGRGAQERSKDVYRELPKRPRLHARKHPHCLVAKCQGRLTCKRAASARAGVVEAELIPRILDFARKGATINALMTRGPQRLDKASSQHRYSHASHKSKDYRGPRAETVICSKLKDGARHEVWHERLATGETRISGRAIRSAPRR
jgi:hypothetical protein